MTGLRTAESLLLFVGQWAGEKHLTLYDEQERQHYIATLDGAGQLDEPKFRDHLRRALAGRGHLVCRVEHRTRGLVQRIEIFQLDKGCVHRLTPPEVARTMGRESPDAPPYRGVFSRRERMAAS